MFPPGENDEKIKPCSLPGPNKHGCPDDLIGGARDAPLPPEAFMESEEYEGNPLHLPLVDPYVYEEVIAVRPWVFDSPDEGCVMEEGALDMHCIPDGITYSPERRLVDVVECMMLVDPSGALVSEAEDGCKHCVLLHGNWKAQTEQMIGLDKGALIVTSPVVFISRSAAPKERPNMKPVCHERRWGIVDGELEVRELPPPPPIPAESWPDATDPSVRREAVSIDDMIQILKVFFTGQSRADHLARILQTYIGCFDAHVIPVRHFGGTLQPHSSITVNPKRRLVDFDDCMKAITNKAGTHVPAWFDKERVKDTQKLMGLGSDNELKISTVGWEMCRLGHARNPVCTKTVLPYWQMVRFLATFYAKDACAMVICQLLSYHDTMFVSKIHMVRDFYLQRGAMIARIDRELARNTDGAQRLTCARTACKTLQEYDERFRMRCARLDRALTDLYK